LKLPGYYLTAGVLSVIAGSPVATVMANPVESTMDNEHWFGFIANQVSNDLQTLHSLFRA
jgi:hypothetical protein